MALVGEEEGGTVIEGSVVGAAFGSLRNIELTGNSVLLTLDNVAMTVEYVSFNGVAGQGTGLVAKGEAAGSAMIDHCIFQRLGTGIEIYGDIPTVRRCEFRDLSANGIVFHLYNAAKDADDGGFSDEKNANEGFNLFQIDTIEGQAVVNKRSMSIVMQNNDWGTNDKAVIRASVTSDTVVFDPPLVTGTGLLPASVVCSVWDAGTQDNISSATVKLAPGSFNPVSNNTKGMYTFACLKGGTYTFAVEADGFSGKNQQATLMPGTVTPLLFPMTKEAPQPQPGCFAGTICVSGEPLPSNGVKDALPLALALAVLAVARRGGRFRRQGAKTM